jgi:hypothetical protein
MLHQKCSPQKFVFRVWQAALQGAAQVEMGFVLVWLWRTSHHTGLAAFILANS